MVGFGLHVDGLAFCELESAFNVVPFLGRFVKPAAKGWRVRIYRNRLPANDFAARPGLTQEAPNPERFAPVEDDELLKDCFSRVVLEMDFLCPDPVLCASGSAQLTRQMAHLLARRRRTFRKPFRNPSGQS